VNVTFGVHVAGASSGAGVSLDVELLDLWVLVLRAFSRAGRSLLACGCSSLDRLTYLPRVASLARQKARYIAAVNRDPR
jgi:hypothetical protein